MSAKSFFHRRVLPEVALERWIVAIVNIWPRDHMRDTEHREEKRFRLTNKDYLDSWTKLIDLVNPLI